MNIIINNTDEEMLIPHFGKILGLLIRVLNYKKEPFINKKILDLINFFID